MTENNYISKKVKIILVFIIAGLAVMILLKLYCPASIKKIDNIAYIKANELVTRGYTITPCKKSGCRKYTIEGFGNELVVYVEKPQYRINDQMYETKNYVIKKGNDLYIPAEIVKKFEEEK